VLFVFDEFAFDDLRYQLSRAGVSLKVDAQVLTLLSYLLKNPARVVSKEELIAEVWQGRAVGDNVISVCVAKLRKALGGSRDRCITNVYGRGYRFSRPVQVSEASAEQTSFADAASKQRNGTQLFVGRSAVLDRLQRAIEQAQRGRAVVCALLGEPGIGKTRAAEVLEEHALKAGFHVAWGRCHAFGDVPPLWPWLQVMRSCGAQSGDKHASMQFPATESAPPSPDTLNQLPGNDIDAPLNDQRGGSWHNTLSWMTEVIARTSAEQPLVIVLEDVQWADAASLQLLAYLVVETAQFPLVMVLTVRDTELPQDLRCRRLLDYVLGRRECERIELSRLQLADVEAYTSEVFGSAQPALARELFAKSEGNPFFMVELLRPWALVRPPLPSELTLSGTSLDIVRHALRRLEPDAAEVLAAASVLGRSFDLGLLATITKRDSEALIELLDGAMSAHVIDASSDNPSHFAFGHDLIRTVLYGDLASLTRIRLHQRVAESLSLQQAQGGSVSSAELAHHLLSALPAGDVMLAVKTAQRAAAAASLVGAYADACVLLRRAREALRLRPETDPRVICDLLFALVRCERAAGEPGFAEHLAETISIAQRNGFGELLAGIGQLMSSAPGTVTMKDAGMVLEAALQALPESDVTRRSIVLTHLAWTPPQSADTAIVNERLREAELLAGESGVAKRTLLRAKLYFAGGPDDHERALAIAAEMEHMGSPRGAKQRARWSLEPQMARIVGLVQAGNLAGAQQVVDAFGAAVHELRHAELIWHHARMCVVLRMNRGDFAYAKTQLGALREQAQRLQLHAHRTLEVVDWAELLRETADTTALATRFGPEIRPETTDGLIGFSAKLRILVQLGLVDQARAPLLQLPVAALYALPKSRDYLNALTNLAFTTVSTGALAHAAAVYELLQPYPQLCVASISLHCHGSVSDFLAGLAHVLGDGPRARRHFEQSLHAHETLGLRGKLARTRYEFGRILLESGDANERRRGTSLVTQARDDAAELTMEPLQASAERLLGALDPASRAAV
jgi:DNA-binding winged helix-turn-helix (wHTH) protein